MSSTKHALLIGNSYEKMKYSNKFKEDPRLRTPINDINKVKEILLDKEIGKFKKENIKFLDNRSWSMVHESIANFFANKGNNDLLFFFYSGHGVIDHNNKLCLIFKDTDPKIMTGSSITFNFIQEMVYDIKTKPKKIIVILNCCHSGIIKKEIVAAEGKMDVVIETLNGEELQNNISQNKDLQEKVMEDDKSIDVKDDEGSGRLFITAAEAHETALEGKSLNLNENSLSIFTDLLIEGIEEGEADGFDVINKVGSKYSDLSDGKIDVKEIFAFIEHNYRSKVEERYGKNSVDIPTPNLIGSLKKPIKIFEVKGFKPNKKPLIKTLEDLDIDKRKKWVNCKNEFHKKSLELLSIFDYLEMYNMIKAYSNQILRLEIDDANKKYWLDEKTKISKQIFDFLVKKFDSLDNNFKKTKKEIPEKKIQFLSQQDKIKFAENTESLEKFLSELKSILDEVEPIKTEIFSKHQIKTFNNSLNQFNRSDKLMKHLRRKYSDFLT